MSGDETRWAALGCDACRAGRCKGHPAAQAAEINGHRINALTDVIDRLAAKLTRVEECSNDFAALPKSRWSGEFVAKTFRAALAEQEPRR